MKLHDVMEQLTLALEPMTFDAPITHVYNPLTYARVPATAYAEKWGAPTPREAIFIGMNPGPWGMAQTGVPFGEVSLVRDFLRVDGEVAKPDPEHPKRPIEGFDCQRSEVSGQRLWGWVQQRFHTPSDFFDRFFVWNYCPLVFMEESGRNFTPDKLPVEKREELFAPCDEAVRQIVKIYQPDLLIGVGVFAEGRIRAALGEQQAVRVGRVLHPSPASPKANRGWAKYAEDELTALGVLAADR